MIEEVEVHVRQCPHAGPEHDCTIGYIMWWKREDFYKWLEAHDREVKAKVYSEAFQAARKKVEYGYYALPDSWNPYKAGA